MNSQERFISAAAGELARDLLGRKPVRDRFVVRQTVMEPPDPAPTVPVDLSSLEALARQVVETVLAFSGQELDQSQLARAVERAAQKHLLTHPRGRKALMARLATETPRLVNLPRLAELAARGLELGPAPVQAIEPEAEIIAGASRAFTKVLADLERVAETDFPVLLQGESGAGKELLARRLHQLSPRRQGPFIAVNCAAIAPGILESELFGHVKGAYTGASGTASGYIGAADGGTLFLDEIGETGSEFQVRLLRVLEDRTVTPVGSHQGHRVDFRLVSASHRDLTRAAAEDGFNQALLYRILVVPLHLPPLRERKEDMPALVEHFLTQACLMAKRTRTLAPQTRRLLMEYDWPGNVRELSNVLQRLTALSRDYQIEPDLLPPEIRGAETIAADSSLQRRLAQADGVPAKRVNRLAGILSRMSDQEITNRDLRQGLDCSDSTAGNILRAMSRAGILQKIGRRGGRRYRLIPSEEE